MQRSEKLTEEQLNRLKFIEGSGLMVRPSAYYNVHFLNKNNYDKIERMFKSYVAIDDIPKNSKGFILPNNNLKKDDIKEICKRYDLKITNDISNADFFIGNEHISKYVSRYDMNIDSRALMIEGYSNILEYEDCDDLNKNMFIKFMSSIAGVTHDHLNAQTCVLYTKEINTRYQNWTIYETEKLNTYITDEGLSIFYNILSKKIPIVSVGSLFQGIDKVTIDADIYDTLVMMLRGSDDDKSVAMNMLYNCNIEPSSYYIWRLFSEVNYTICYYKHRNTKAHKNFIAAARILDSMDDISAVAFFKEKDCLTEEIYNKMIEKIHNRVKDYGIIEDIQKNNLLKVSIEPLPYDAYMLITKTMEEIDV